MTIQEVVNECRASQDKEEVAKLLEYLLPKKPKIVVEIGVHKGYSMEIWSKALMPELIIGIEPNTQEIDYTSLNYLPSPWQILATKSTEPDIEKVVSDLITKYTHQKTIDFLFIDGDHTYEVTKQDVERFLPLMSEHGIIAIHDISRTELSWVGLVETAKVFNELKEKYDHTSIQRQDGPGIGVLFI